MNIGHSIGLSFDSINQFMFGSCHVPFNSSSSARSSSKWFRHSICVTSHFIKHRIHLCVMISFWCFSFHSLLPFVGKRWSGKSCTETLGKSTHCMHTSILMIIYLHHSLHHFFFTLFSVHPHQCVRCSDTRTQRISKENIMIDSESSKRCHFARV